VSGAVVALCEGNPDAESLLAALSAAGGDLRVAELSDGAALRLVDDDGRPVLTVEVPLLVHVAGELGRLLGPEVADVEVPVWWVDLHPAAGHGPTARQVGAALVEQLGGRLSVSGSPADGAAGR